MELYLLKSGACLAIFFVFYKLILENENMHQFKRFYLLGMLVVSFGIPLITFTTYVEVLDTTAINFTSINSESQPEVTTSLLDYLPSILWTIYFIGGTFFSFRFIKNLSQILFRINRNQKVKFSNFINVLLNEKVIPHTFFSYIFLNKQKYDLQEIPSEVILHEQTHAKQKHSFDVLFIEILQVVFWFNPFMYFIKHSIKLNHEFLADQAVLNQGIDASLYQNILLAFSSEASSPRMANSINYSFIKKRFTVMKTHTSKSRIWFRSLLLLPLLAVLIYGFSSKNEAYKKNISNTNFINNKEEKIQIEKNLNNGATKSQLAEYNKLAKKYNNQEKENQVVLMKDLERLKYIYGLMTPEQKANAEPFPDCFPPPPPMPPKPKKAPKVIKGVNDSEINIPPPPPPPVKSTATNYTLEQIIKLAEEGAHFILFEEGPHFKDGREINAEKAIDFLKRYKELDVKIRTDYDFYTIVEIKAKGC